MPRGPGLGGFGDYLANYQVNPNQYLQQVLSGHFLGEGNPYLQDVINNLRRESLESYEQSLPMLHAGFAGAGRFGGGAQQVRQVLANEEFNEGLTGAISQLRQGQYQFERDNMMRALEMLSGENIGARNVLGGVKQSHIEANARRAAARIAAGPQYANVRRLSKNDAFNRLLSYYNAAGQQASFPFDTFTQGAGTLGGLLSNFGTQSGSQTTPGMGINTGKAALSGAGQGALSGAALGGAFNSAPTAVSPGPYAVSPNPWSQPGV